MAAERNKLRDKLEKTEAHNTVINSELTVIKKEILKEKMIQQDLEAVIDDKERKA